MNEKPEKPPVPTREPTLAQALVPIAVLVGLLASSVILFGDESSSGPNQIALMLSAGVGIIDVIDIRDVSRFLQRGGRHERFLREVHVPREDSMTGRSCSSRRFPLTGGAGTGQTSSALSIEY